MKIFIFRFFQFLTGGIALCAAPALLQAQTTRYVKPTVTGTGDGLSWANAGDDLQAAINASSASDNVWVAAGIYSPLRDPFGSTTPPEPRDKTFFLKDGVKLYGGFNAISPEATLEARNIAANPTLLSGDIGTLNLSTDNCYHVVLAAAASSGGIGVTINGFSVTGGNANGSGAISMPQTINRNRGGGICLSFGTNIITNNYIAGNTASADGGGLATEAGNNTFTSNTFSGNTANNGGGIYTTAGTNILINNTLLGNTALTDGGGACAASGTSTLTGNAFSGNLATFGGGISYGNGSNTLTNNLFSANVATAVGGAMTVYNGTNLLTNNTLSGNAAATQAGGIYTYSGTNTFKNNLLWGNTQNNDAGVQGADYYANGANGSTFLNNLLQLTSGNYPVSNAGAYGIGTGATGNLFATDPLFVDANGTDNIAGNADDNLQLRAGSPAVNTGTATGAPSTDMPGIARPQGGSIDLGAYEFPCPAGATLYADVTNMNSADGQSWATAYKTLSEALAVAHYCPVVTTIHVAAGLYKPTQKPFNNGIPVITTDIRDVTFQLRDGLALYGGYPAGGGTRNVATNATLLSGDLAGDDDAGNTDGNFITENATEIVGTDNAYHVVLVAFTTAATTTRLDGFTITGGNANGASSVSVPPTIFRNRGGGIYANFGTSIFEHNTISGNNASIGGGMLAIASTNTLTSNTFSGNTAASGGGVYAINTGTGTNTIVGNTFSANTATTFGGGMYATSSNNTLTGNTFSGNTSATGGGIHLNPGSNTLSNNTFRGNTGTIKGGGISTFNNTIALIIGNTLSGNTAGTGGGICISGGTNTLTNNTLSANTATTDGGGIYTSGGSNALNNNIFWENKQNGSAIVLSADYYALATNSNTFKNNLLQLAEGNYPVSTAVNYGIGTAATGNLFATDPLFVDADGADNTVGTPDDDLRLQVSSPVRNTGLNSAVTTLPHDIVGNTRTFGGTVDMGAYEQFDLAAFAAVTGTSQAVAADGQYTDPNGWTHYVHDATDKYILSIKKNGNDIGSIGAGLTVTAYTTSTWSAGTATTITPNSNYVTNGGWNVMNRWWDVSPASQPTTDVQVRTYYTQDDLDGLNAAIPGTANDLTGRTQLRFYKINAPAVGGPYVVNPTSNHSGIPAAAGYADPGYWEYTHAASASATTWADGTISGGFYAEITVASFSGGGGGGAPGGGGAFPVEWLSFSATPAGETVVLDWSTASEQNNASFTAERSLNGVDFEAIGTVAAIGNSSTPVAYSLTDNALPAATTLHYRIRQTDTDGKASHSETRTVTLDQASGLVAWPNPATSRLAVRVPEGVYAIVLADETGRVVRTTSTDGQAATLSVDLSGLAAGVYVLRAGTATIRVVKE